MRAIYLHYILLYPHSIRVSLRVSPERLSVCRSTRWLRTRNVLTASGIRLSAVCQLSLAVCHRDSPPATKYRTTPARMIFRRSLQCHFSEISLFTRAAAALHVVHVEERDVVTMASER